MAVLTFELEHGYKVGDDTHLEVGLRELDSGDLIDAQLESEKVIVVDGKAIAYTSDVLYGLQLLGRQLAYIGRIQGPFKIKELKKLHPDDFKLIQEKAQDLDRMLLEELENRGRS
ncbi:TPA: phage tail assembly protein [Vibrio cholerae]|nr:phage tail assembly protein [Vibrio cholerae]